MGEGPWKKTLGYPRPKTQKLDPRSESEQVRGIWDSSPGVGRPIDPTRPGPHGQVRPDPTPRGLWGDPPQKSWTDPFIDFFFDPMVLESVHR
jgi:hypothetical protein